MTRTGPLGIGIVGCGAAALPFADALGPRSGTRLVATFDRITAVATDLAERHRARVHADLDALLADPAVETVYVALPHDQLAPTTLRVLAADRPVLVEKPAAITIADLRMMAAAADDRRLALGVVFELRHVAAVTEARRLVRSGAIGRPVAARIRTVIDKPLAYWKSGLNGRSIDPWRSVRARAGGGVVMMNTIHQLDLVRFVAGLVPERAIAITSTVVAPVEVEDVASAAIAYVGGGLGSVTAAAHAPGALDDERIEIDGTHGAIRLPDPYVPGAPVRVFLKRPWRELPARLWLDQTARPADPYSIVVRRFAAAVRSGRSAPVGVADAEIAVATVLAIYRSAASGRSVSIAELLEADQGQQEGAPSRGGSR